MKTQPFSITLGGIPITIYPLYPETSQCFGDFCKPFCVTAPAVILDKQKIAKARTFCPPEATNSALEYNLLVETVCNALLPFKRCVFHGVAFLWHNKAYILTAPSGTGKTTQYVHWRHLYGDELRMLNGDKPVLECRADGTIWVHPSPWMGKEGWGRRVSASLGGIIYLSQSSQNSIARVSIPLAVLPLFRQFLFSPDSEKAVHQVCAIEEQVLCSVPVWHLANRGDEASARLCHDTLLQFEEGCV